MIKLFCTDFVMVSEVIARTDSPARNANEVNDSEHGDISHVQLSLCE